MKILVLHNRYREAGGEDAVVRDEIAMLRRHGNEVQLMEADNSGSAAALARHAIWSTDSYKKVQEECRRFRPDIAHVHNFWIELSPSVHAACQDAGVPSVQSLHNFRLLCVNAVFLRNGQVCEDCLGKLPWRGVVHRCYHGSLAQSAAVAGMICGSRVRSVWDKQVNAFIVPSRHSASKFIAGGLDAAKLFVKPHFVADPGAPETLPSASGTAVYVGRLSPEKGASVLLRAWAEANPGGRLIVIGKGPDQESLQQQVQTARLPEGSVIFAGQKSPEDVLAILSNARVLIVPSLCYETFGRAVIEAFCCGRGVIVSSIGAVGELVEHGKTGLTFPPGNTSALASAIRFVFTDDKLADTLGQQARRQYLAQYTPEKNYQTLMDIYQFATAQKIASKRRPDLDLMKVLSTR